LIGAAFRSRRDRVFIASKVGMLPSSLARYAKAFMPFLRPARAFIKPWKRSLKAVSHGRQDFSVSHITSAVEGSLKRLRTDYLDLLQLHSPPVDVLDRDEVFDVLLRLSDQGKVRFFGVSSRSIRDAFLWLKGPMLSCLQVPFNLLDQEGGRDFFSSAAAHGVAVIVRVPFARGLLTSKGVVATGSGIQEYTEETARTHLQELSFLELEGRRSITQASLQFILSHPEVSVVIPGTGTVKHLEENVRSPDSPALTERDLQRIFVWQAKRAPSTRRVGRG
jgi:aryl-alcohol dehydrogenase-like predicted oxidoreductase